MTLAFRVYGIAEGMGSKRAFVPKGWTRPIVTDSNRSLKSWQQLVREAAADAIRQQTWTLLEGPVRLLVAFYFPRPKSLPKRVVANTRSVDVDKLARAVADALTGLVYRDDVLVCELLAAKYYAAASEVPHVDVRVEPTVGQRPSEWPQAPAPLFQEPLFAEGR
jgi:crossover junction endodeoxyribonuclease RusA